MLRQILSYIRVIGSVVRYILQHLYHIVGYGASILT